MNFSVLMSIYHKEDPLFLTEALESIVTQTLLPNEIVIVIDGPIPNSLETVLETYNQKFPELFQFVRLRENLGLGHALHYGVLKCQNPIIARMDSDDICNPLRFEKQISFMKNHPYIAVVGSWIYEFHDNWKHSQYIRKVPITADEVKKFCKRRNPLNHMTVMFRKECVLKVGNYRPMLWNEDYYLWIRLVHNGYKIENISEPLVYARANENLFKRRGGFRYMIEEFRLQRELLTLGFIRKRDFVQNLFIRGIVRIVPNGIRAFIYKHFLRKKLRLKDEKTIGSSS